MQDQYTEAFGYLFGKRLNIEVLLLSDADGDTYLNLRARPWKNSPQDGYMLLVGGYAFDDCLVVLAEAFESARWHRLDWTARIQPPKSPPANVSSIRPPNGVSELDSPAEPRFKVRTTDYPYTR